MRSRPEAVKESMRCFPPGCEVRAREGMDLKVPASGMVGRVVSWFEDGSLGVVVEGGTIRGQCEPGWLEVVGYPAMTPDDVASILDHQAPTTP